MYSIRMVFSLVFLTFVLVCSQLNAALKYQQEITISSFKSEQDSKEMVYEFLKAARGDPDFKVVGIRYNQEEIKKDFTSYNAIIKCHVSQPDKDVLRIQEKVVQNNKNIKGTNLPKFQE